jgi:hypothetical protein
MAKAEIDPEVIERLAAFFRRNGYLRSLNAVRRKKEGRHYKKGDEVRLVAESRAELAEIRRLLKEAGFTLARPFSHSRQWRQPIYGIAEVARFRALIGKQDTSAPPARSAAARSRSDL